MDDGFELDFGEGFTEGPVNPKAPSTERRSPRPPDGRYLANIHDSSVQAKPPATEAMGRRRHTRGGRIIAEDPEKSRIVGRSGAKLPEPHGVAQRSPSPVQPPPPAGPAPSPAAPPHPPAPIHFEGTGLKEVGTLKKGGAQEDDDDDEFSYAFEGGKREGEFHKQVFRPKAMPVHLVSNVKQNLKSEVLAEVEEEEEEEEEEGSERDQGTEEGAAGGEDEEEEAAAAWSSPDPRSGLAAGPPHAGNALTGPTSVATRSSPSRPAATPQAAGAAAAQPVLPSAAITAAMFPHAAQHSLGFAQGPRALATPPALGTRSPRAGSSGAGGGSTGPLHGSPGVGTAGAMASGSGPHLVASLAHCSSPNDLELPSGYGLGAGLVSEVGDELDIMGSSANPKDTYNCKPIGSWTTFAVSDAMEDSGGGRMLGNGEGDNGVAVDSRAQDLLGSFTGGAAGGAPQAGSSPTNGAAAGAGAGATSSAAGGQRAGTGSGMVVGYGRGVESAASVRATSETEDLPSYRLMQALHATPSAGCTGEHATLPSGPSSTGRRASAGAPTFASTTGPAMHAAAAVAGLGLMSAAGADPGGTVAGQQLALTSPSNPLAAHGPALGAAGASTDAKVAAAAWAGQTNQGHANGSPASAGAPQAAARSSTTRAAAGPSASTPAVAAEDVMLGDEWDQANRQRAAETAPLPSGPRPSSSRTAPMSYHEALVALMGCDLSAQRAAAAAMLPPPPGVLSRLLCMAPPELRPPLLREQLLQLLALARLPMDDGDETHVRLLGSVYAGLTGKSCDQPRYGSHWAAVGFQGQDPATDLRGCGMLGLLQLHYLHQWSPEAASKMLRLSQHPVHEFPLAIVSLNVTKWTLQALRSGSLHSAANARGSAVEAAQEFYAGAMATFYSTWLRGAKTMADSGHVLKELEAHALKRPGHMLAAAVDPNSLPEPPAY